MNWKFFRKPPEAPETPEYVTEWLKTHQYTKQQWEERERNAKKVAAPIRDAGILRLIIAPPGTGKDYYDREDIVESIEHHEYNTGNFLLHLPYWLEKKYWKSFVNVIHEAFRKGVRYHFTDSSVEFDCREWTNTPPLMRAYVALRRHFECSFTMNMQFFGQVDITFVKQCDEIFIPQRIWRFLWLRKWTRHTEPDLNKAIRQENDEWLGEDFWTILFNPRRIFWMNKKIWAMYDTLDLSMMDSAYQAMKKSDREDGLRKTWEKRKKMEAEEAAALKKYFAERPEELSTTSF